jgi:hypothetical protein
MQIFHLNLKQFLLVTDITDEASIVPIILVIHKIVRFRYFNSLIGKTVNINIIMYITLHLAFVVILNTLYLVLHTLITSYYCGNNVD